MKNRKNKDTGPNLIAITGNFGTGKSTVGDILEADGETVFDTDNIVHEILRTKNKVTSEIIKNWGEEVKGTSDYIINKKKLAEIIFNNKSKKEELEKIIHPAVEQILKELIDQNHSKKNIFVLVPLLFECSLEKNYHIVWCIRCDKTIQEERLLNKGFTIDEINKRLSMQMPQEKKEELSDNVIDNSFNLNRTKEQVRDCKIKILST